MKFNERLLDLRKKKGWSQEELGYKLDVSRQTISKWEAGQTTPELEKLRLLAKTFEISVDELINEDEEVVEKETITVNKKKKFKKRKIVVILAIMLVLLYVSIAIFRFIIIYKVSNEILYADAEGFLNYHLDKIETRYMDDMEPYYRTEYYYYYTNEIGLRFRINYYPKCVDKPQIEEYYIENRDENNNYLETVKTSINYIEKTYSQNVINEEEEISILFGKHTKPIGEISTMWNSMYNSRYLKNQIRMAIDFRINIGMSKNSYMISNYKTKEPQNDDSCEVSIDTEKNLFILETVVHDKNKKSNYIHTRYKYRPGQKWDWENKGSNTEYYIDTSKTKLEDFKLPDLTEFILVDEINYDIEI